MLPTEKTRPKSDLSTVTILAYGPSKFGKSEMFSQAENALFLATEPGLNHLETFQVPITSWEQLLAACAELAEGKHSFRTVVVDTVDNAHRLCAEHICRQQKIAHESDLAYSKGYALVANEFQRVLTKLTFLGLGVVFISHSQEREVDGRTGKYTKLVPSLPEKPRRFLTGLCDLILFADFEPVAGPNGERSFRRVLRTKPSQHYEAGDRTGRLPDVIDFDYRVFAEEFRKAAPPSTGPAPAQPDPAGPTAIEAPTSPAAMRSDATPTPTVPSPAPSSAKSSSARTSRS